MELYVGYLLANGIRITSCYRMVKLPLYIVGLPRKYCLHLGNFVTQFEFN